MPKRFATQEVVLDWWPVVVLPPIMVLDAALSSDPATKAISLLSVLATVVGCLPLVLRRHLSFATLVGPVTAGTALVVWRLDPVSTIALIPMVALLEMAMRGDRRRAMVMAVVIIPCVILVVLILHHGGWSDCVSSGLRNIGLCELAIIAGDWLRVRREEAQRTADASTEAALRRIGEERLQIAREIHDVVAHAMTAINVQAGVAAHLVARDPDQAHDALRAIKRTSGEALTELRATLEVLRDPRQTAPLGPSVGFGDLEPLAVGLRQAGVQVALDLGELADLPASVQSTGYRIVQEALTNVARHAQATHAWVRVRQERGVVTIEVSDDGNTGGNGADTTVASNGLRGMRERAAAIGGAVKAAPQRDGGWLVQASLPVGTGEERQP